MLLLVTVIAGLLNCTASYSLYKQMLVTSDCSVKISHGACGTRYCSEVPICRFAAHVHAAVPALTHPMTQAADQPSWGNGEQ